MKALFLLCGTLRMQKPQITFGSRGKVWEVRYIPFGLPVVAMEFDSVRVTFRGCRMPSVAGSNAKPDWRENMLSGLTYKAIQKIGLILCIYLKTVDEE